MKQNNQPIILVLGFKRPTLLRKVLKEATASGLKTYVSLDRPKPTDTYANDPWSDCVSIAKSFSGITDVWTQELPGGCCHHIASAITRAFSICEEVIILEDDTIPSQSFFQFCVENLKKYNKQNNVGMICGSRLFPTCQNKKAFFSNYPIIWGWATWKRVWNQYESKVCKIPSQEEIEKILPQNFNKGISYWLHECLTNLKDGKLDTWDIQLLYLFLKNKLLCIYPEKNLITNIGFPGADSTHVKTWEPFLYRRRFDLIKKTSQKKLKIQVSKKSNLWYSHWMIPEVFREMGNSFDNIPTKSWLIKTNQNAMAQKQKFLGQAIKSFIYPLLRKFKNTK